MDNLEPRAAELLVDYAPGDQIRARAEIHPGGKQDVELYIRTYNTMLRSSGEVKIKALEQAHIGAAPTLHVGASAPAPDMDAFMYSVNRLPSSIWRVRRVLLGQSAAVFHRHHVPV